MILKTLGRLAMVATVASAGVLVAAPASAASTLFADLDCEALGRQRVLCLSTVTGGTPPYTRMWFYNDLYFPTMDGKSTTSWSCVPGGENVFRLAVIDTNFELVFAVGRSGCNSGNP